MTEKSLLSKTIRANLKSIVGAYRKVTGTSLSQVSKKFYGNAGFLEEFFAGQQSVSLQKLDRMLEDIIGAWPDGAEWPYCRAIMIRGPKPTRRRKNYPQEIVAAS